MAITDLADHLCDGLVSPDGKWLAFRRNAEIWVAPMGAEPVKEKHVRRLSPNGLAEWTEVLHRGWEGMVAKDPESPYVAGRTLRWLKAKVPKYREGERGWEPRKS